MRDAQVRTAFQLQSSGPEETLRLGERLASYLQAGDLVLLRGSIGAGKSVFARGIAIGMGVHRWRGSPTFTLVNEYETDPRLYHVDLYRLEGHEVEDLGLEEYAHPNAIVLVEWADRAYEYLCDLATGRTWTVDIDYLDVNTRTLSVASPGLAGTRETP